MSKYISYETAEIMVQLLTHDEKLKLYDMLLDMRTKRLYALLNASSDKEKAINVALEVIETYFKKMAEKERRTHPMTNKLASIPAPISARIDELNELVEKHPQYIPVTAVAVYLGVNPEGLRRCIEAGQCPFGIAWNKSIGGNKAFKIPTLTFYLWVTQCCAFRYATVSPDFGIDRENIS